MTREDILLLYKNIIKNNPIPRDKMLQIITTYCLEFSKKQKDIDKLLLFLAKCPIESYLCGCFNNALEYYGNKFNIILITKNNIIIKVL